MKSPTQHMIRRDQIRSTQMSYKWKALLWIIHSYANDRHRAWCSVRVLARESCISRSAVQRLLTGMEEAGLITRTARLEEGDTKYHRKADVITIHLAAMRRFKFEKWYASQGAKKPRILKKSDIEASHAVGHPGPPRGTEVGKLHDNVYAFRTK